MWVINIQHWLDETMTGPAVPRLRQKVKKLSEIVTYSTSVTAGIPTNSAPKCWRRPNRKPCEGILDIHHYEDNKEIHWYCDNCEDEGVVSGWEGLIWDMRNRPVSIH